VINKSISKEERKELLKRIFIHFTDNNSDNNNSDNAVRYVNGLHFVPVLRVSRHDFMIISVSKTFASEAQNLLGCTALFLTECRPMFQRCVLPPSSPP
jgi:hypothetical protein